MISVMLFCFKVRKGKKKIKKKGKEKRDTID